jgi:hypothetical protein
MKRRNFLKGLAGASIALPLLPSLTRAQSQEFPTRFIAFFHPNGVEAGAWFPQPGASTTDFTLNRCHAPLEPWKSKIVVTSGINMAVCQIGFGEPHQRGMGAMLTGRENNNGTMVGGDGTLSGWNLGTSLDQVLASRIGGGTRFSSLELGVRADVASSTGEIRNRMVYAAPELALSPTNDPRAVFDRVFSDASTDIEALRALRDQRKSVLDTALASFDEIQAKVPAAEREKLEQHAAMVRDLENRLTSNASFGGSCVIPSQPPFTQPDNENDMPTISRLQIDLLVMSLACDLTRVGSLQYSNALNHVRFPWLNYTNELGESVQSLNDGHALSHDQNGTQYDVDEEWITRDIWYAQEFAYLLDRLNSIPEGDGTLLDHTVILWVNELAHGAAHTHENMPFVVAGGGSGRIRTGQYLSFDAEPHNNLLLALLHAFGFDDASFGHPDYCTRELPGLLI